MPNYMMDLRKYVGHKPLIMVGASVILKNAARRELAEETGLAAEELELFGVFSGEEFHHIYPNQDEVYIVDVVYLCKTYTGQLKAQKGEVERMRFFSADELPENISPPVRPVIEEWLTRKRV